MDDATKEFQDNYREIKFNNANKTEKMEREFSRVSREERIADRKAKEELNRKNQENEQRIRGELELQMKNSQRAAKKELTSLNENYTENVKNLNKFSELQFEKLREENQNETNELKKELSDKYIYQREEQREMFLDKIEKLKEKYERRIADLQIQSEEVKANSQDLVNSILRKTSQEIQNIKDASQKDMKAQSKQPRIWGSSKLVIYARR
jgi:hypothetical protein